VAVCSLTGAWQRLYRIQLLQLFFFIFLHLSSSSCNIPKQQNKTQLQISFLIDENGAD